MYHNKYIRSVLGIMIATIVLVSSVSLLDSVQIYELKEDVVAIFCTVSSRVSCENSNEDVQVALAVGKNAFEKFRVEGMRILLPNWMFVQTREKKVKVGTIAPTFTFFSRV